MDGFNNFLKFLSCLPVACSFGGNAGILKNEATILH